MLAKPEPLPDRARRVVVPEHFEADDRRAFLLHLAHRFAQKRRRDALPPRARAYVHEDHVRATFLRPRRAHDSDCALVVFGDVDGASLDVGARVGPRPVPGLVLEPLRLGHLALELLPELAQDRLVRLGRAADPHPAAPKRIPVKR